MVAGVVLYKITTTHTARCTINRTSFGYRFFRYIFPVRRDNRDLDELHDVAARQQPSDFFFGFPYGVELFRLSAKSAAGRVLRTVHGTRYPRLTASSASCTVFSRPSFFSVWLRWVS